LVQGQFNSNATAIATTLASSNMMMPFGENSIMFIPGIQGEFTKLFVQAHHQVPTCRRLQFDK